MTKPILSIVLGSYNRKRYLKATLESIRKHKIRIPYEIIVVDGGSTDGALAYLTKQKDLITIIQHNRGYWHGSLIKRRSWGYFMNLGFKAAQGKYICMISDDCLLVPGAIENGYRLFERLLTEGREVGAMAFYWRDWPQESRYYVFSVFGKIYVNHGLYLKQALEKVGYVNEEDFLFYNADQDLCLRMIEAGYETVDSPDSFIEHHMHANPSIRRSNLALISKDTESLVKRWKDLYPSYQAGESFQLKQLSGFQDSTKTANYFHTVDRWSASMYSKRLTIVIRKFRGILQIRTKIRKMHKALKNGLTKKTRK